MAGRPTVGATTATSAQTSAIRIYLTRFTRRGILDGYVRFYGTNDGFYGGCLRHNYAGDPVRYYGAHLHPICDLRSHFQDVPTAPCPVLETWPLVVIGWYHVIKILC